jgi:hypothetical protein
MDPDVRTYCESSCCILTILALGEVLLRVDLKTFLTLIEASTDSLFQQTKRIVLEWCYLIEITQKENNSCLYHVNYISNRIIGIEVVQKDTSTR